MKIVLAHGVFDLLHHGQVQHLRIARGFGDRLVVSVVADKFCSKRTPIYDQETRMDMLKEMRCVDQVMLCNAPGPQDIIESLRPDVYVRGGDYVGKRMPEHDLLDKLCIPVGYTKSFPYRTTELIERFK